MPPQLSTAWSAGGPRCDAFACDLVEALIDASPQANICISPICLAMTLLLAAEGAAGRTREEINAFLGAPLDREDLCEFARALWRTLDACTRGISLTTANGLFVSTGEALDASFLDRARRCHGTDVIVLPPHQKGTPDPLTAWVRDRTEGRLAPTAGVERDSSAPACTLVSVVSLKAPWQQQFDPAQTCEGDFISSAAARGRARFMTKTGLYDYFKMDAFEAVSLDFAGGALGLDVMLPGPGFSPRDVLPIVKSLEWNKNTRRHQEALVEITLPSCEIRHVADLRAALATSGVTRAFGPGADFSAMGLPGHFIGRVRHDVRLRLDEQGAEAEAMSTATMIRSMARPVRMRVDRPFLYAVREGVTGCPLFLGAMFEPSPP